MKFVEGIKVRYFMTQSSPSLISLNWENAEKIKIGKEW